MGWTPDQIVALLMLLIQSGLIQALVDLITAIFGGSKSPEQVHTMVMGILAPFVPGEAVDVVAKLVYIEISRRII